MTISRLKNTAYATPETATERDVRSALDAQLAGPVSPPLEAAVGDLLWQYDRQAALPDVERAERYVQECWLEYTNPPGAFHKGAL